MSTSKPTIACFGATGGCVGATLACALKQGHYCNALARTPHKLREFLASEHQLSVEVMAEYLTIYEGDAKDPAAVAKALVDPINDKLLVDVIVSGVGSFPTFQWSITRPFPLRDPTICETAAGALFRAVSNLESSSNAPVSATRTGGKPLLIVVSTGGCGRGRGIPLPIYLPYHYLLGSPLADKRRMESVIMTDKGKHIRDFIIVRPLILTNGEARGDASLRVGWEWGLEGGKDGVEEPGPVIGYTVSRKDVGTWIFDKAIVQGGWEGKGVYLTY